MDRQKPTAELINIIKDLFYNSTSSVGGRGGDGGQTDERDAIIRRVDAQFNDCDARIDKYIRNSSQDLTGLIKVFNGVARKIEGSRTTVKNSREALKQCKVLLQSKRDDVRRLWLEWCEQKYYFDNLSKLKQLYTAGEHIRECIAEKNYVKAAEVASDATRLCDTEFRDITGLNEIKRSLDEERIKLEKHLQNELTEQLYKNVSKSVLESGSSQDGSSQSDGYSAARRTYRISYNADASSSLNGGQSTGPKATSSEAMIQSIVQSAAKLNSSESNINILEKMINDINKDMSNQLVAIVNSTSNHVVESNLIGNISQRRHQSAIENNPKYLSQLIELVFEQFKMSARLYKYFVDYASKFSQPQQAAVTSKYQYAMIWSHIQSIMVQLLEEYLDTRQSIQNAQINPQEMLDRLDINSFFARRRLLNIVTGFGTNESSVPGNMSNMGGENLTYDETSQKRMFTFRGSSHAMSINNYIREKNNENLFSTNDDYANREADHVTSSSVDNDQRLFKILVCQPDHRNITTIFAVMERIMKDIADETRNMGLTLGDQQSQQQNRVEPVLEKFLQEFILKKFITNAVESIKENARIHSTGISITSGAVANGSAKTNQSNKVVNIYDMSKQLISLQKQKELGLSKPILESIMLVFQSCTDLFNLIKDMNSYASEFANAMQLLIQQHYEYSNNLFNSIVSYSNGNEPTYVYSMLWVQDDAIKTYFKQMPAFASVIKNRPTPAAQLLPSQHQNVLVRSGVTATATSTSTTNMNSQNPDVLAAQMDMEQYNLEVWSKECETLIGNLNDVNRDLEESDLITNFNYIEMIAHLHESSDWLIVQLKYIFNSLEQMVKNPTKLNNSLSLDELNNLKRQLDELDRWRGDTLLLLYLEIRIHCFFHLMMFIRQDINYLGTLYSGDVDTDPDECVLNMNRDLHRIYEHLTRSLQETKVNYIFDGLGFMIATIFIRAISNFKKISSHGIAKMCRNIFHVEQNLSAMRTKADPHLMKAYRFYELLYKKPEELVQHLQEHEPEFVLNEYISLLNLIYRSQPGYEINSLSENIQALNNIPGINRRSVL